MQKNLYEIENNKGRDKENQETTYSLWNMSHKIRKKERERERKQQALGLTEWRCLKAICVLHKVQVVFFVIFSTLNL